MEKSWFVSRNGEQLGPYSWDEIVRQAEEGSLNPQEFIWSEGMKDWQPAQSIEGLFKGPGPIADTPPPISPQPVRPAMKRTAPKKNVMLPVVIAVATVLLIVGGVYAFSTLIQQDSSQDGLDELGEDWREHWPYLDEIQGLLAMGNGEQPPLVNGEPPENGTPPPGGGTPPPGGGTPPPGGGGTPTAGDPVARISVNPLSPRAGDPVTFGGHESSSASSGGQISKYSWLFSDGIRGTGVSLARTFDSAGFKTVTLTVTDEQGKTGSTSSNIIVLSARTDPPTNGDETDPPVNGDDPPDPGNGSGRTGFFEPSAKFTFSPAEPVVDQTVTFDARASSSLNGGITKYEWSIDDSVKRFHSTVPTMTRSFTSSGTYMVKLTVTDVAGKTNSIAKKVVIIPIDRGGVGQFPIPDITDPGSVVLSGPTRVKISLTHVTLQSGGVPGSQNDVYMGISYKWINTNTGAIINSGEYTIPDGVQVLRINQGVRNPYPFTLFNADLGQGFNHSLEVIANTYLRDPGYTTVIGTNRRTLNVKQGDASQNFSLITDQDLSTLFPANGSALLEFRVELY